jgi:hypothetical protein
MYASSLWYRVRLTVACILACNYFAFQVELFEAEYEANHPAPAQRGTHSLSLPSVTWESFDKQNAPEAFVLNPILPIEPVGFTRVPHHKEQQANPQYQPVRDKSPPFLITNPTVSKNI